jgi:hypothetical protein
MISLRAVNAGEITGESSPKVSGVFMVAGHSGKIAGLISSWDLFLDMIEEQHRDYIERADIRIIGHSWLSLMMITPIIINRIY